MKKKLLFLFFHVFVLNFSQNKIDSLLDVAFSQDQVENPQLLIRVMTDIIQNPKSTDVQKMKAYNLISVSYTTLGEHTKSIEASLNMKKVADKIGSLEAISFALSNIADSYRSLDLLDEALDYYKQSSEIMNNSSINESQLKFNYPVMQYDIGYVELLKKNFEIAIQYFQNAIKMSSDITTKSEGERNAIDNMQANFYLGLGYCYTEIEKFDSAEIAYIRVRDIIDRSNNMVAKVHLLKGYGDLYYKRGEFQDAIDSLKKAEELMFMDDNELKSSLYELLVKSYAGLKNYQESEKYYLLANEARKREMTEKNKATSTVFTETKKELNQKLNIQKQRKEFLTIIIIILVIVSFIVVYINRKKRKEDKLRYIKIIENLSKPYEINKKNGHKKQIENQELNSILSESNHFISKEVENGILKKLERFENSEKFIKKDISLPLLASQLGTNTNYLSQIINNHKNKNFNAYINELRIQYIIKKIHTDSNYHNYKISYLAEECGMPYSSFTSLFKSFTGMTPSTFVKQAILLKRKEFIDN